MKSYILKNTRIINEGKITPSDVYIKNGRIEKIGSALQTPAHTEEINADGKYLIPGIIDDQVHFREPGMTHKANIYTEAKAAVAGGVTSFMEMPNTTPPALTQELLQDKYDIGEKRALANYSFFMGASNDNISEILKTDPTRICGIKVFMGSSTGNMLVDEVKALENIFREAPTLVAVHCEDESTIRNNEAEYRLKFGENVPIKFHPYIRNVQACHKSSSQAVDLAKKFDTRLHILHISTADELHLFDDAAIEEKRITSEVCVHHLWFDGTDYDRLGTRIKCNPAIKAPHHKEALLEALLNDQLDIIATDHAPHTIDEKKQTYFKAPSGIPLVQHSLNIMLELHRQGKISLEKIIEKMCHAPARCFQIKDRGFIREGFHADLALLDVDQEWEVKRANILHKCGWSPFEGETFHGKITHTFVSGHLAYLNGVFDESKMGSRLAFVR